MEKRYLITESALKRLLTKISNQTDKKINEIPIIENLNYVDEKLKIGEEKVITIKQKRII